MWLLIVVVVCLPIASTRASKGFTGAQNLMTERERERERQTNKQREQDSFFHLCSPPNTFAYLRRYFSVVTSTANHVPNAVSIGCLKDCWSTIWCKLDCFGARKMFSGYKFFDGSNSTICTAKKHFLSMFQPIKGLLHNHVCSTKWFGLRQIVFLLNSSCPFCSLDYFLLFC